MTPRALVEQAIAIIEVAERDDLSLADAAYTRTVQIEKNFRDSGDFVTADRMTANRLAAVEIAKRLVHLSLATGG